jgi:LysR family nitrogen assimilation transcriptional regulator
MVQTGPAATFDRRELPIKIRQPTGESNVAEPKLTAASLDLRPLYYFVHVADTGSFSRAAAALSVGQPIISRAIRNLEQDLQVALLHRHGRGVSLTHAGEELLARAKTILQRVLDTRGEIAARGDVPVGNVEVAMPPLLGDLLVIELIKRLRAEFPLISINIHEGYAADSLEWLSTGAVDIALIFNAPKIATLLIEHVLDDEIHLVGIPGSLDSTRAGIPARQLRAMPLLPPPEPHRLRALINHAAHEVGIELKVEAQINGVATLLELVKAGIGYTVLPATLLQGQIKEGRLQSCPIIKPKIKPRLFVATSMQRPQTAAKKTTLKLISELLSVAAKALRS